MIEHKFYASEAEFARDFPDRVEAAKQVIADKGWRQSELQWACRTGGVLTLMFRATGYDVCYSACMYVAHKQVGIVLPKSLKGAEDERKKYESGGTGWDV